MLYKTDKHSFNVFCIDPKEMTVELWNHYDGWKMLWRAKYSPVDMIEELYKIAQHNWTVTEEECLALNKKLEAAERCTK